MFRSGPKHVLRWISPDARGTIELLLIGSYRGVSDPLSVSDSDDDHHCNS